jgi:hypothetical protein
VDLLRELHIDFRPPVVTDDYDARQVMVGRMHWQELANLIAEVADAATEPWRDAVDELLRSRDLDESGENAAPLDKLRELRGPVKFSEARAADPPEAITRLVQHVAGELDRDGREPGNPHHGHDHGTQWDDLDPAQSCRGDDPATGGDG